MQVYYNKDCRGFSCNNIFHDIRRSVGYPMTKTGVSTDEIIEHYPEIAENNGLF
jgi:hypothetical protein